MLYHLAIALTPTIGAFNALTYLTVRAGGAMVTGFLICLFTGPPLIRWLRALKIGQHIKQEHVGDLHRLHEGKSGTPTMGGILIILSTLATLLLWSTLGNRLVLVAAAVLCLLGGVGFIDDMIKLRRRRNDGLTARAKFTGQIIVGALLGAYVVLNPVTDTRYPLAPNDILNWSKFANGINPQRSPDSEFANAVWSLLEAEDRARIDALPTYGIPYAETRAFLLATVNRVITSEILFDDLDGLPESIKTEKVNFNREGDGLDIERDRSRINRMCFEAYMPGTIRPVVENQQTHVGVPGFKDLLIPFGAAYVFFVILIIVGASNAVNITDGLDGLAIGASIIALVAYAAIAYVVSRADWSSYLYLTYVPEASELTVFASALLGTGLGFLWFNSHPAEVFMGDTGSLALGGVIGAMAILTKQELLLPLVGGLFVLEALSVMIQVGSFKLTGKRVFRMAPLHHHFELKGWSETKVTTRFWILAILFALMSLGTLKLR